MTLNIFVNITALFIKAQFVLTTPFQHNYMLEFPICCILIWTKASVNARLLSMTIGLLALRIALSKPCIGRDARFFCVWNCSYSLPFHYCSIQVCSLSKATGPHNKLPASLLESPQSPQSSPKVASRACERTNKKKHSNWCNCVFILQYCTTQTLPR